MQQQKCSAHHRSSASCKNGTMLALHCAPSWLRAATVSVGGLSKNEAVDPEGPQLPPSVSYASVQAGDLNGVFPQPPRDNKVC